MRCIVDDLDGRRRALFEEAKTKINALCQVAVERAREQKEAQADHTRVEAAEVESEPLLSGAERRELARWRNLARYQPPVVDYLKAQVLMAEKRYADALTALERVTESHLVRPGVFLQTADLYLRLRRERDAQRVYEKALAIDPDNAHAYIGLCRMGLRRRKFGIAAHAALDALQKIYHDPLAHFLLGRALAGMKEYEQAAEAFRAAISFNPNFPEAHARLADLLEKHLGDIESAREHRRLARSMRSHGTSHPWRRPLAERVESAAVFVTPPDTPIMATTAEMPPLSESLVVVTGLPRSGTSLLMQMLAAGGAGILSDDLRAADQDNPRGYLEFDPVKNLLKDSKWLFEARGRVIKIIAPLLVALPPGLACRIILCERDLDEVLDSQERMLLRRNQLPAATPRRRRMLKDEYMRTLVRVKAMLTRRTRSQLLVVEHSTAISDSLVTAERINQFLGGGLDVAKMAAAVEPTLHRNRAVISK
jgi:tetratricopeptide (TPR) repeat protein